MKLVEFAKQRGIARDTITQYIRRNPELFKGHTEVKGKLLFLDAEAERLLNEKYPLPALVEVIRDTDTIERLLKAQETIIQLQARLVQAEAAKLLLEDKQEQLQRSYDQCDKLQSELDIERSKTWWDKLRGR